MNEWPACCVGGNPTFTLLMWKGHVTVVTTTSVGKHCYGNIDFHTPSNLSICKMSPTDWIFRIA
jgi:hypothetical protein